MTTSTLVPKFCPCLDLILPAPITGYESFMSFHRGTGVYGAVYMSIIDWEK